jgi:hypothetical protein
MASRIMLADSSGERLVVSTAKPATSDRSSAPALAHASTGTLLPAVTPVMISGASTRRTCFPDHESHADHLLLSGH